MTTPAKAPHHPGPMRIAADAEDLGRGLGQLVVALLELVRDLLERQAIRRVEGGGLTDDEVERLGQALLVLEDRFAELRDLFDVERGGLRLPVDIDELVADRADHRTSRNSSSRTHSSREKHRQEKPGGMRS